MTDRTGRCLAVNLYNLAPGKGVIIGDSVAIAEPFFAKIDVARNGEVSGVNARVTFKRPVIHFFLFTFDRLSRLI